MGELFDDYASSYDEAMEHAIGFAGVEHDLFLAAKARALLQLGAELADPSGLRLLDVGAGNGKLDLHMQPHVGELHGVDVSERMVVEAQSANPAGRYAVFDGARLPYDEDAFDMTFAVCVFHHVEPEARGALASEMARVVRPGGIVAIAEHNPFNPLTRLAVVRCEFDKDVRLLRSAESRRLLENARLVSARSRYLLFAPTLSSWWLAIERRLRGLPLGAQYIAAANKPG